MLTYFTAVENNSVEFLHCSCRSLDVILEQLKTTIELVLCSCRSLDVILEQLKTTLWSSCSIAVVVLMLFWSS